MNLRIAVHLGRRCLEDLRAGALRKAQQVDCADHAGLGGLNRIALIVDRRGRAGKVVNFIDLDVQRERDVVAHELEPRLPMQVVHVVLGAGEQVVYAQNVMASLDQPVAKMGADEAGAAGDENTFSQVHDDSIAMK